MKNSNIKNSLVVAFALISAVTLSSVSPALAEKINKTPSKNTVTLSTQPYDSSNAYQGVLMAAAARGDIEAMKSFKDKTPHIFENWANRAASEATEHGQTKALHFIINNAPSTIKEVGSLYQLAARNNHADILMYLTGVQFLTQQSPKTKNKTEELAFTLAVKAIAPEAVAFLSAKLPEDMVRRVILESGPEALSYTRKIYEARLRTHIASLTIGSWYNLIPKAQTFHLDRMDQDRRAADMLEKLIVKYTKENSPKNSPEPLTP